MVGGRQGEGPTVDGRQPKTSLPCRPQSAIVMASSVEMPLFLPVTEICFGLLLLLACLGEFGERYNVGEEITTLHVGGN